MPTAQNRTILQSFEWHTPSPHPSPHPQQQNRSHYSLLTSLLPSLSQDLGITSLWLPPGCKANDPSGKGNGYDCYDLWDLGEFDQKWRREVKWGSREELEGLIEAAKGGGEGRKEDGGEVEIVWDAVLSHKTAGDDVEETWAVEVDPNDRHREIASPKVIRAWLKYDFPGRRLPDGTMAYSSFQWRAEHFNGTDWDEKTWRNAIYKLIDEPATTIMNSEVVATGQRDKFGSSSSKIVEQKKDRKGRIKSLLSTPSLRSLLNHLLPFSSSHPHPRPGKTWASDICPSALGNGDYLIFSNIYYAHPAVREEILSWGRWMVNTIGITSFRIDAAMHISCGFLREWIAALQGEGLRRWGRRVWVVGEVWSGDVQRVMGWVDAVTPLSSSQDEEGGGAQIYAYDVPLLMNFSRISEAVRTHSRDADLRTLLMGPPSSDSSKDQTDPRALVSLRPENAVTFVANHDTQPGQGSYTPMDAGLKALFYAFILLRKDGVPCVFWGDLAGTQGPFAEGPACCIPIYHREEATSRPELMKSVIPSLMLARKLFAYGEQRDYFDSAECIGWTRAGTGDRSGCVIVISIGHVGRKTWKRMAAGREGERWVDVLQEGGRRATVVINGDGFGDFPCGGCSVGVFVREECEEIERFPVVFGIEASTG